MSEPHYRQPPEHGSFYQGNAPYQGTFSGQPAPGPAHLPQPGTHASPPSTLRTVGSWVWALSPAWSLGFSTTPIMVFATVRFRHWAQALLTAVYLTCAVLMFIFAGSADGTTEDAIFSGALAFSMFVGTGHALVVRGRVFERKARPGPTVEDQQRQFLAVHAQHDRAREVARTIVTDDPPRAIDLRIGRIDIGGRPFPDGGLIDVNNVELSRLGREVEVLQPHLAHLDRTRRRLRGFGSVEDMSVALDLAPHLLDHVENRLVFLPRYEV